MSGDSDITLAELGRRMNAESESRHRQMKELEDRVADRVAGVGRQIDRVSADMTSRLEALSFVSAGVYSAEQGEQNRRIAQLEGTVRYLGRTCAGLMGSLVIGAVLLFLEARGGP